jgi:hypothetical protein
MCAGVMGGTSLGVGLAASVASSPTAAGAAPAPYICAGTDAAPGQLAGIIKGNVVISGTCWVNAGVTAVYGDVTVDPGGSLNATFGQNDQAGYTGYTALFVTGNIFVEGGATLALGCEPNFFPCQDDPVVDEGESGPGTLSSHDVIGGNIIATGALGVLVHSSVIFGDITQSDGGGGASCATPDSGYFASTQAPAYSDYEDNSIGGNLTVQYLDTCWFGAERNTVGGSVEILGNTFGDPGADEVLSNQIAGSISCTDDSPQVQYGSTVRMPNQVQGWADGECGFTVLKPDPAPSGPLTPISVLV